MLKDLLYPSRELVVVEIGSEFLKLIHFKKIAGSGKILNLTSKDIRTLSDDDIATWIKSYLAKQNIKSELSTLSVITPRYSINKNIELPSTDPSEISEIIKLQASRHTPYAREEIVIDYIPITTFKGGYTKVLLVIVNRDVIKKHEDIITRAGLGLKKSLAAVESITQWYYEITPSPGPGPVCLLHFDYGSVDFIVASEAKPVFARSILLGAYELTHEEAPRYREQFIDEIKSSLESYQTESTEPFEHIVLLGAIDNLSDLTTQIEENVGKKVSRESYLNHIALSSEALAAKENVSPEISFLPVISTALQHRKVSLDFTPEEIRLREAMAEKSREIIFTGTLVMFILILIALLVAVKLSRAKAYLDHLNQQYRETHPQAEELKAMKKKSARVKDFLARRILALDGITKLYEVTPEEIYLSSVSFKEDTYTDPETEEKLPHLVLKGISKTEKAVFYFKNLLRETDLFNTVDIRYHKQRERENFFDFEMECRYKARNLTQTVAEK